jgi:hypothetical protein
MTNTDIVKLTGGKRKNGHKMDCNCHICENMKAKAKRNGYTEDIEREKERKTGEQKVNGHKKDCGCPICKNMKNAKGIKNVSKKNTIKNSGKKSNGHKLDCGCPICKNMKKKKGGSDEDAVVGEPKEESNNIDESVKEDVASENEYDTVEETPKESKSTSVIEETEETVIPSGGTRKRRGKSKGKRSNGHKPTCCCPICKNTRKGKKTRKHRRK